MRKLIAIFIIAFLASACASSTHVRKCGGGKGVKVPMGVL